MKISDIVPHQTSAIQEVGELGFSVIWTSHSTPEFPKTPNTLHLVIKGIPFGDEQKAYRWASSPEEMDAILQQDFPEYNPDGWQLLRVDPEAIRQALVEATRDMTNQGILPEEDQESWENLWGEIFPK